MPRRNKNARFMKIKKKPIRIHIILKNNKIKKNKHIRELQNETNIKSRV